MISKFFIERPVLAYVVSILFVLLGVVAIGTLPIAEYPQIVPPTIQVTANYPGADAKTLVNTVALPIEQQVNGVQDMLYMQSTSTSSGAYTLIVTFAVGTDLNFAQVLVQNRVSAALAQLPASVQKQGVVVQQKSTSVLQFITLTSPDHRYDGLFLNNYAIINMQNALARLPGVGNVLIFGTGEYAMRIWLDPAKMQAYGLNPSDILNTLRDQNVAVPAGQVGGRGLDGRRGVLTVQDTLDHDRQRRSASQPAEVLPGQIRRRRRQNAGLVVEKVIADVAIAVWRVGMVHGHAEP